MADEAPNAAAQLLIERRHGENLERFGELEKRVTQLEKDFIGMKYELSTNTTLTRENKDASVRIEAKVNEISITQKANGILTGMLRWIMPMIITIVIAYFTRK